MQNPGSDAGVFWFAQVRTTYRLVIPGRASWRESGIHNHDRGVWIPGSTRRVAPE